MNNKIKLNVKSCMLGALLGIGVMLVIIFLWLNSLEVGTSNATDTVEISDSTEVSTQYRYIIVYENNTTEDITTCEDNVILTKDIELETLARLVYAEAGNQDEIGKRLVIDTVLNRVDDSRFPNNINDVIYQKGQYSPSSHLDDYPLYEEIYQLIIDELNNRYDSDVLYFQTKNYHDFGTPLFKHQDHYFSK